MKTYEEICEVVKSECPEMLSDEKLMHDLSCRFCTDCKTLKTDMKTLSDEEYEAYKKVSEKLYTANVGQLIKYLQENFKLDDKVCYMDCIQGYSNDCKYMTKDQLGDRFFKYVKDIGEDKFPFVNSNDVIVC